MAIDTKKIQLFICSVLKFFINLLCRFIQKHPVVSIISSILFALYLFLPKVFIFLIYFSPFLACAAAYIRFYLPSQRKNIRNDTNKNREISSATSSKAADGESRTILQRNVKAELVSTNDRTILTEEKPSLSRNASIGDNLGAFSKSARSSIASLDGLEEQIAKGVESSSSEGEEEDEGVQRGIRKALEWTEDDQKNLMDLGISELERNKRLESLIARRRARKLYKMNTEKILIYTSSAHIPVAPVLVPRAGKHYSSGSDDKIPGSAPSVMLPSRNPFDIPYDPHEEKPDLMADSFQQEFMSTHQGNLFFRRHENLKPEPSFSLDNHQKDSENAGDSIIIKEQDKGDGEWLVDHEQETENKVLRRSLSITDLVTEEGESSNLVENKPEEDKQAEDQNQADIKGKKPENSNGSDSNLDKGNQIQFEAHKIEHHRSESSLSSLSDDYELTSKSRKTSVLTKIQPPIFRFPDIINNPSPNSDPCPLPKARGANDVSYLASPSTIDRSSLDNHLLYTNSGPWHTPTNSVASDMQVEVSELGSPPLTGDGSASSNDGESLTYDGDIEKDITSGSDDMWGISPHAPKAQEYDLASTEVNYFGRDDITGGFSGFHIEPEASVASSSGQNLRQGIRTDSVDCEEHQEDNLHKPQELLNPSEKTTDEVEINSSEDKHGEAENPITLTTVGDFTEPAGESESVNNPVQNVEMATSADVVSTNVTKEDVKSSEERNQIIDRFIEQEVLVDLSKRAEESSSESRKNSESISDEPPTNPESISNEPPANPESISDEPPANPERNHESVPDEHPANPESVSVIEQPSTVSSASSSPKSVLLLPDRIPLAESSSDLNQLMQVENSDHGTEENIVRDSLLYEQLPETSVQNEAQQATEDSENHQSIDMSTKSEEIFNTSEKSSDEAKDGESEASISNEAAVELTNPLEEINSRSIEQISSIFENLAEDEARTDQSNEKEHQDSEVSELAVTKENVMQDADTIATNSVHEDDHIVMNTDNDTTSKDTSEPVADGEKQGTSEQSEVAENPIPNSGSIEFTEAASRNSTEAIVNSVQLQTAEEISTSNDMTNIHDAARKEGNNNISTTVSNSEDPSESSTEITQFANNIVARIEIPLDDEEQKQH
ncbi:uncharacterized protein LOC126686170 [Mercurialis annua]|uniref:uncharacterized protein LOC126686170 n=1 Tax=Mercurialis annua TaxID=3986 RepID=UPI00215E57B8|nr:uncharacterized protein LOC126686170 [Mercurialis annua]